MGSAVLILWNTWNKDFCYLIPWVFSVGPQHPLSRLDTWTDTAWQGSWICNDHSHQRFKYRESFIISKKQACPVVWMRVCHWAYGHTYTWLNRRRASSGAIPTWPRSLWSPPEGHTHAGQCGRPCWSRWVRYPSWSSQCCSWKKRATLVESGTYMDCTMQHNIHEIVHLYGFGAYSLIYLYFIPSCACLWVSCRPSTTWWKSNTVGKHSTNFLSTLPLIWKWCNIRCCHHFPYWATDTYLDVLCQTRSVSCPSPSDL